MANDEARYQAMYEAEQNAKYQAMYDAEQAAMPKESGMFDNLSIKNIPQNLGNLVAGGVRGAGSIGATILAPYDMAKDAINGKGLSLESNRERRQAMDSGLQAMGADTNSGLYATGKLGSEIAGTAGIGNAIAGTKLISQAPKLANAISSGGFSLGSDAVQGLSRGQALAQALTRGGTRVAGGAINGGLSTLAATGDIGEANTGAILGGAIPAVGGAVGLSAKKLGSALAGNVSPEVQQLASRANDLGIDIPLDRIKDSKALNALSAGLNYVPFSGRAATESTMNSQLNRALSRTFGQDSDNVTMALRKASIALGGKFDDVLKNNTLKVDNQFLTELGDIELNAAKELGSEALHPIKGQLDEILAKTQNDVIDGQAAYNIKRTLDRIGKGNNPNAYHAREVKKALMGALDRSIGVDEAAKFANTRQQYGNMLSLENLAKNGVEGEVSAARLANLKNINNPQLQEMADISAQFVKPREGQHGAAQRALAGLGVSTVGGIPGLTSSIAAGRLGNALLNSKTLKNVAMGRSNNSLLADMLSDPELMKSITQSGLIANSQ